LCVRETRRPCARDGRRRRHESVHAAIVEEMKQQQAFAEATAAAVQVQHDEQVHSMEQARKQAMEAKGAEMEEARKRAEAAADATRAKYEDQLKSSQAKHEEETMDTQLAHEKSMAAKSEELAEVFRAAEAMASATQAKHDEEMASLTAAMQKQREQLEAASAEAQRLHEEEAARQQAAAEEQKRRADEAASEAAAAHAAELDALRQEHADELASLSTKNAAELASVRQEHEVATATAAKASEEALSAERRAHEQAVAATAEQHMTELAARDKTISTLHNHGRLRVHVSHATGLRAGSDPYLALNLGGVCARARGAAGMPRRCGARRRRTRLCSRLHAALAARATAARTTAHALLTLAER
jgi:hypothetical protein